LDGRLGNAASGAGAAPTSRHRAVRPCHLSQPRTASSFLPLSSDAKSLDGLNVHFACLDEIGSHRTARVYDIILTALGKRLQPLLISISTATANITGIGKQIWDLSIKVLTGVLDDERASSPCSTPQMRTMILSPKRRWRRRTNPGASPLSPSRSA
jgi:hypothetical protein